jgi:hypothetical protein
VCCAACPGIAKYGKGQATDDVAEAVKMILEKNIAANLPPGRLVMDLAVAQLYLPRTVGISFWVGFFHAVMWCPPLPTLQVTLNNLTAALVLYTTWPLIGSCACTPTHAFNAVRSD